MNLRCLLLCLCLAAVPARSDLTVFAASSTTDVVRELGTQFGKSFGERVHYNFASSGTLARQIDAGAQADVFVSANTAWMDFVADRNHLAVETRTNVAANALVLIAPRGEELKFEALPGRFEGRLAVGDFNSVPAGMYAECAMKALGWLPVLSRQLVQASNVRTVLLYVERGEVEAGVVYATDAGRSKCISVVGELPATNCPPIVYPASCLKEAGETARPFVEYLSSDKARAVWRKHGFLEVPSCNR